MSKEKISSQEMVEQIAAKLSVSKRVAEEFLKSLFAEIEETLLKGEPVKIKNLGTFKMQWNEPRKSVNVQTGEVFTIEGYNKVTFTPDAELKDAVNEPYSHLEPVELDGQEIPTFDIEKPVIQTPDSLRNITEQATEIKDILSEINALSTPKEVVNAPVPESVESKKLDIPDYEIILIDEEEESNSKTPKTEIEPETSEEIITNEPEISEPIETIPEQEPEKEIDHQLYFPQEKEDAEEAINSVEEAPNKADEEPKAIYNLTPEVTEYKAETTEPVFVKPKKKRKGLRFLIVFIIVLLIIAGGIYAAYFSSSCIRCWVQYDLLSEANREKLSEYTDSFKGWFVSDKKTPVNDSIKNDSTDKITLPDTVTQQEETVEQQTPEQSTDSLEQLFNSRREYTEFLGEEEISEGTRLTNIAQHYYGKKEFWVYIYEANRDNIVHPDRITPGTVVKIPKVDPRLIDKKNPRCIQKAKELHDLYVGKK